MSSNPSEPFVTYVHDYFPPGVSRIIAWGINGFIGQVDNSTVLKYNLIEGDDDMSKIEHEHQLLNIVGPHARIIASKGLTEHGLYLELAENGNMLDYLVESKQPDPSLQQRLAWCREIAEAVEYVHSKRVIHCGINPLTVLIDKDYHIKLSDFQGRHLDEAGQVVMDELASEPYRYFCPREDVFDVSWKTDIFALGSTIYFIMTGQEVFPDIVGGEERWREKIESRFASGVFPDDPHACAAITQKCWQQQYVSASEVLEDIRAIEKLYTTTSTETDAGSQNGTKATA
ncbi:hypothetical protein CP533_3935 [Ophiocordyceps camponoti-saundersi (nom. inval.)]|nr:hypothetical protein CP533_3935 [Ophiocordyceps camponoti-saundersi (nom. inval.)]